MGVKKDRQPYCIVGIDPGLSGAMTALFNDTVMCDNLPKEKVPTATKGKTKNRVHIDSLYAWIKEITDKAVMNKCDTIHVYVEFYSARPSDGKVSLVSFIEACATVCTAWKIMSLAQSDIAIDIHYVTSTVWQKAMFGDTSDRGRSKKDREAGKEKSREMAAKLFPSLDFSKKVSHNKAESALIATFGLLQQRKQEQ